MDKKYIRVILMIIIILLVIIFGLLIYVSNIPHKEQNNEEIIQEYQYPELLDEEIIIPDNSYLFFDKYKDGKVSSKDIYSYINIFATQFIPDLFGNIKGKNNNEVIKYCDENKNQIKKYLEFENDTEINDLINTLQRFKVNNLKVQSMEFEERNIKHSNQYTMADLIIKYNDDIQLKFRVKVYSELQENDRNVSFSFIK